MSKKIFGDQVFNDEVSFSTNETVTAQADGTLGNATQLTESYNIITSSANNLASVKLLNNPEPGTIQIVKNSTVYTLRVYAGSGGQIATMGTDIPLVVQPNIAGVADGECFYFIALSNNQWLCFSGIIPNLYQFRLIQGVISLYGQTSIAGDTILYSWLFQPNNYTAPLTAFAGGGQASATAMTSQFINVIGTCATDHDSVRFVEVGSIGGIHVIWFNNTNKIVDIYPYTGGTIDQLATNAPFSLKPKEMVLMAALDNVNWKSIRSFVNITSTDAGYSITGDLIVDTNTLYVDSTNNRVGIGTLGPTHALTVSGIVSAVDYGTGVSQIANADANTAYFNGVFNAQLRTGNVPRLHIHNQGYFGFKTIAPHATVHIVDEGNTTSGVLLIERNSTTATLPSSVFRTSRGTNASKTVVVNGDYLGGWRAQGYTGSTGYADAAEIRFSVDGTVTNNSLDMPGRISMFTTPDGSSTLAERIRITNDGITSFYSDASTTSLLYAGAFNYFHNTNAGCYWSYAAANTTPLQLVTRKARGTLASPAIVVNGDGAGGLYAQGYDGTNFLTLGRVEFSVDGVPGTNDMPGRLVFRTTADGASSDSERMRITSAGLVGINTSTPSDRLTVSGSSGQATIIRAVGSHASFDQIGFFTQNYNSAANSDILSFNSSGGFTYITTVGTTASVLANSSIVGGGSTSQLMINSNTNATTGGTSPMKLITGGYNVNPSIYISGTGSGTTARNVGIRNSAPLTNFDITGNTNITGDLLVSGNQALTGTLTQALYEISNKTSSYPLTNADCRKVFTNTGASGQINYTLPAASAGQNYTFICLTSGLSNGIRITAGSGDTIRIDSTITLSGHYIEAFDYGSTADLISVNSTEWICTKYIGSWTVV